MRVPRTTAHRQRRRHSFLADFAASSQIFRAGLYGIALQVSLLIRYSSAQRSLQSFPPADERLVVENPPSRTNTVRLAPRINLNLFIASLLFGRAAGSQPAASQVSKN